MAGEKSPEVREQELLEERAALIVVAINANPKLVKALQEGHEAARQGRGMPAQEYFEQRGGRLV